MFLQFVRIGGIERSGDARLAHFPCAQLATLHSSQQETHTNVSEDFCRSMARSPPR